MAFCHPFFRSPKGILVYQMPVFTRFVHQRAVSCTKYQLFACHLLDGLETSEVGPGPGGGGHEDERRALHHGVVDGYLLAAREDVRESGLLTGSVESGGEVVHQRGDGGHELAELRNHSLYAIDEYARIPEVSALSEILLRHFERRLFLKFGDFLDVPPSLNMNISILSTRIIGCNSYGHY